MSRCVLFNDVSIIYFNAKYNSCKSKEFLVVLIFRKQDFSIIMILKIFLKKGDDMKKLLTLIFVATIMTLCVMNGKVQGGEHPKSEHPKGEAPKAEASKAEVSKEEHPKSEESKKEEHPKSEESKKEESKEEHPKSEQHNHNAEHPE